MSERLLGNLDAGRTVLQADFNPTQSCRTACCYMVASWCITAHTFLLVFVCWCTIAQTCGRNMYGTFARWSNLPSTVRPLLFV